MADQPQVMLDVSRMTITPEGVVGFHWPVGFQEVHAVRDAMIYPLAEAVGRAYAARSDGALELAMLAGYLVLETMTAYQAHACFTRLGARGLAAELPWDLMPTWAAVARQRPPETPPLLNGLLSGHGPRGVAHRLAKTWRGLSGLFWAWAGAEGATEADVAPADPVVLDDPPRRAPTVRIHSCKAAWRGFDRVIVCTRRGRLQSIHAVSAEHPVVLVRHGHWFRPLDRAEVERRAGDVLAPGMADMVLDCAAKGFAAGGIDVLPGFLAEHLGQVAGFCAAAMRLHLDRLRARPGQLPRELWTGTGGNIWDVMLRAVVRERGGRSVGHSHSGGSGHLIWPFICFYEYPFLDAYMVYSDLQAELSRRHTDPRLLMTGEAPVVAAPPALRGEPPVRPTRSPRRTEPGPVRRVMYVGTSIFAKDRLNLAPAIPDVAAVDWQARLFAHLREWGYEVLHKPHPESFLPSPEAYRDLFGAEPVHGRFEETCNHADLYLFDTQSTTTFPVALRSLKPVVFVDLGRFVWEPDAYELLKRRCAMVKAGFGPDNRIQIDWQALRRAIEAAPALVGDRGLADRYFG